MSSAIEVEDVINQLEWFLENNDWVESTDCDNVDNQTKEAIRKALLALDSVESYSEQKEKLKEWLENKNNYIELCNCDEGDCLHKKDEFPEDLCKYAKGVAKYVKVKEVLELMK